MRKAIKKACVLLSFAIALNTFAPGFNSIKSVVNAEAIIKGDVNCDGIVSGADALSMTQYLLGQFEPDGKAQINSDIDSNGKINIVDMILIKEMLISGTSETTTITASEPDNTSVTTPEQTVTSEVTTTVPEQTTIEVVTTTTPEQTETETITTTMPEQTTTASVTTTMSEQTTTTVTTTPKQTTTATVKTTTELPDMPDPSQNEKKKAVAELVNKEREKNGFDPMQLDTKLSYVADIRADELKISYTVGRPDGSNYTTLLNKYHASALATYQYIMRGNNSASEIVSMMLKRGAFLNSTYKKIGVGFASGGGYWVVYLTS